jgi:hypothetical protein
MRDPEIWKRTIGGSEIGAVLGCDERCDPFTLVARKRGELPRPEVTERMLLGNDLEQGVLCAYARREGCQPQPNKKTFQHDTLPFMVFTPDALVPRKKAGRRSEVRPVRPVPPLRRNFRRYPEGLPAQCYWYMAGTGYPKWVLAALVGDDLRTYEFERDLELEEAMRWPSRIRGWEKRGGRWRRGMRSGIWPW